MKDLLKNNIKILQHKSLFIDNIPAKKLKNAIKTYATDLNVEDVLLLVDETIFGSAKDGFIIAPNALYARTPSTGEQYIPFDKIKKIERKERNLIVNGSPFITFIGVSKFKIQTMVDLLKEHLGLVEEKTTEPDEAIAEENSELKTVEEEKRELSTDEDNEKIEDKQEETEVDLPPVYEHVMDLLEDIEENTDRIFMWDNLPQKRLLSAIKSYGVGVSGKQVLLLVDTTMFKGAKEGLIITENFAYAKTLGLSGKKVKLEKIRRVQLKGEFLQVNDENFVQISLLTDASATCLISFFRKNIADNTKKREAETLANMSDGERTEFEFLSQFSYKKSNFITELRKSFSVQTKVRGLSNHLGDFWQQMTAVSYEQKNDAFRRDAFEDNRVMKIFAKEIDYIFSVSLNFSTYINKQKKYSSHFEKFLDNEYVAFEVLCCVILEVERSYAKYGLQQISSRFISTVIMQEILFVKDPSIQLGMSPTRLQMAFANSSIAKLLQERFKIYNLRQTDYTLCTNLIKACVVRDDLFKGRGDFSAQYSVEENALLNVLSQRYQPKLQDSCKAYLIDLEENFAKRAALVMDKLQL